MAADDDEGADGLRFHYRSSVVEKMIALLNVWNSPRFLHDIVGERGRGLGTLEVRVLWTLGSLGPSRASELAAALATSAPNISKAVAKLDMSGLVERMPNAVDQRSHTLRLTAEGRRITQGLYDVGDAMVGDIFSRWDDGDVAAFTELMVRFADDSQAHARRLRDGGDADGAGTLAR
jgi:DNA-binding MarR family transcriptional regulator